MSDLRRIDFRDPAKVLESREEGSCRGCLWLVRAEIFDIEYVACRKDQSKHWQSDWKSRRCGKYETEEDKISHP